MMELVILGNPISQGRPRFVNRGKFVSTYNPNALQKKKTQTLVKTLWKQDILMCAVELDISFHVQIPKSFSKKKKLAMEGMPCMKKVDCDNFLKFYLDVFNGILYEDDSQIVKLTARKFWSNDPKTVAVVIG